MQEPQGKPIYESQAQAERAIERRGWLGCLLTFLLAGILVAAITALPMNLLSFVSDQPTWQLVVAALAGLALTLAIAVAGLVLILYLSRWTMTPEQRRHERGTRILRRTLPELDLPEDTRARMGKADQPLAKSLSQIILVLVGVVILALAVNAVVGWLLPGAPEIVDWVIVIWILAVLARLQPIVGRKKASASARPAEKPYPQSNMLGGILLFLFILAPVLAVIPLVGRLPLPLPWMAVAAMGGCTIVFAFANMLYLLVPFFWIQSPVKRGDYSGGLARARWVERFSLHRGFYLNLHGVILLWAGRYDEARQVFEESIGAQRQESLGGGNAALENIGCALAWQGRYTEAVKMFQGSIEMSPSQAMVYSDLAEAYLHQGVESARALELTDRAWTNFQASFELRWLSPYQAGQILSTRAWALARLGRHAEAEKTLRQAFVAADRKFKPVWAGIHLRAGYVFAERGEGDKAREYFAEGRRIDPEGHYGRLCAQAIAAEG